MRWPSVCATGRPSRPRAFGLSATHDLSAPLRDACCRPAGEPCAFLAHKRLAHNNWTACRCPCRWPAATRPDLRPLPAEWLVPRTTRPRCALPGAQRMRRSFSRFCNSTRQRLSLNSVGAPPERGTHVLQEPRARGLLGGGGHDLRPRPVDLGGGHGAPP